MKNYLKHILSFVPAALCMVMIFLFSSQDYFQSAAVSDAAVEVVFGEDDVGSLIPTVIVRKAAHFFIYATLGALIYFGLYFVLKKKSSLFRIAVSVGCGGLYAATDELHQYFVPGRAGMIGDVFLDTAGAAFGAVCAWLLVLLICRMKKKK